MFYIEIGSKRRGYGDDTRASVLSAVDRRFAEAWPKTKAAQESAQVGQRQPNRMRGLCAQSGLPLKLLIFQARAGAFGGGCHRWEHGNSPLVLLSPIFDIRILRPNRGLSHLPKVRYPGLGEVS